MANHAYEIVPGTLSADKSKGKYLSVLCEVRVTDKKQRRRAVINFTSAQSDEQFKAYSDELLSGTMHWQNVAAGGDARKTSLTTSASLSDFKGQHNARLLVGEIGDSDIAQMTLVVDPGHIRVPFKLYVVAKEFWGFSKSLQGTCYGKIEAVN